MQDVRLALRNLRRSPEEIERDSAEALRAMLLDGEPDILRRPPRTLSFGQQRRLTVALALEMRPRTLILDEPTAGQDLRTTDEFMGHVLAAESVRSVYFITHDVDLALTLADARDVVGAWRASGRTAMVGFSQRFHPLVRRARSVVRGGRIGSVVAARFSTLSPPRDLPAWKRARADGGGALLDLASHQADLARFLFGEEVRDVAATARSIRTDDDDASMTMTMESGVHVDAHASFRTVRENRFEILGEEGRVVVDRVEGRMRLEPIDPRPGRVGRLRRIGRTLRAALASPSGDPSYALALSAFVRAAREGSHPDPNPEDGERSLVIVIAAETAARDGRRTPVPPPTPT